MPDRPSAPPLIIEGEVVCEQGRWVVYLLLTRWAPTSPDAPFRRERLRIREYATRADAEVASLWMQRGAARERPFPSSGL